MSSGRSPEQESPLPANFLPAGFFLAILDLTYPSLKDSGLGAFNLVLLRLPRHCSLRHRHPLLVRKSARYVGNGERWS